MNKPDNLAKSGHRKGSPGHTTSVHIYSAFAHFVLSIEEIFVGPCGLLRFLVTKGQKYAIKRSPNNIVGAEGGRKYYGP